MLVYAKIAINFIGSKDGLERVSDCSASRVVPDNAGINDKAIIIAEC
jgi:hypothetical protein